MNAETFFALIPGSLTALWAYTKYVLEKELLPPVQFYVECRKTGRVNERVVLETRIHLHNLGSATLVAQNIRLDVRYMRPGDSEQNEQDSQLKERLFENQLCRQTPLTGRLFFRHSLMGEMDIRPSDLIPEKVQADEKKKALWQKRKYTSRGFLVLGYDTFVKSGVDQNYTFVTTVPADTVAVLVWCSFQYVQHLSSIPKAILNAARKTGLAHFSLQHIQRPHTIEKVFWLAKEETGKTGSRS